MRVELTKEAYEYLRNNLSFLEMVAQDILGLDWNTVNRYTYSKHKSLCHYSIVKRIAAALGKQPEEIVAEMVDEESTEKINTTEEIFE